jgi:glycosyltransferase involved in cell wall biosynthesis
MTQRTEPEAEAGRTPALSVTVTNYNYGHYLPKAIESILDQSFDDFELVVIDNASTDDSLEVLKRYANADGRVRIIAHAENQGLFASLRESCDVSRGRYRVHVDADDWVLTRDAFAAQVEVLDRQPQVAFVYSSMTMMNWDKDEILVARPYDHDVVLSGAEAVEAVLSFNLNHSGMMLRLDAYRAGQGYGEGINHAADMLLGVRLCAVGDVAYLDRKLYAFGQHDANLHGRPNLHVVRNEYLPIIDEAFNGPLGARMPDARAVRRRVMRRVLVHLPTEHIFTDRAATGWRLYWESCKVAPFYTIVQPRTVALIGRTLLGARCYGWARQLIEGRTVSPAQSRGDTR